MNPVLISLGVGVDSSAVLIGALADHPNLRHLAKRRLFIATSDLEVELPETYEFRDNYLDPWLAEQGQQIHILPPQVRDRHGETHSNLARYYLAQAALPSRQTRACTERFKIKTIQSWAKNEIGINGPTDVVIGFDCHEGRRAAKLGHTPLYRYLFPMIDLGIDRLTAAKILLDAGLPVPRRSACFCCSFSKSQDWWELSWRHPELFNQAVAMETNIETERGRTFYFQGNKPLSDKVQPRRFQMPPEAIRLYERAQHHLAHISPAWPSYALSLAAQELYGADWPAAVGSFKLGPARLDDPWQIYTRLQYCLELGDQQARQFEARITERILS